MSYVYPFLLRIYVKKKKGGGGGNKAYNFSLATCNEASLGLIGILAIGPFN
jgi:hypothetical protein